MAVNIKKFSNNESGQAMIELMVFLPFLFMFFSVLTTIGNAINGSINQQKVVRGYFYMNLQNNSKVYQPQNINPGWQKLGMYSIGWREKFTSSDSPLAPCYKLNLPISGADNDSCEEPGEEKTLFIRVETVYGLCGPTMVRSQSGSSLEESLDQSSNSSCIIQ